jgi:D-Tyr-tRNAtyr deacylase
MAVVPPAIIWCNNDISQQIQETIVRQLFIDEVIEDGYVFDLRVVADPDYNSTIKKQQKRLMVVRTFEDLVNLDSKSQADILLWVSRGLIAVECKSGHCATFRIADISWKALGMY